MKTFLKSFGIEPLISMDSSPNQPFTKVGCSLINWVAVLIIPLILFALSPMWSSFFAEKKNVEYYTSGKTRVNDEFFGISAKNWPEVKASYKGKPIEDATFVKLSLVNTGGLPIKKEDFEGSIVVESSVPDVILSYRIVEVNPPSLKPKLTIAKEGIKVEPLLLNPGDSVEIELFGKSNFDVKDVKSRVTGVRQISKYVQDKYSGLRISKVEEKEYGRSMQKLMFNLPPYAICAAAFSALMLSNIALRLNLITTRPLAKILVSILCALTYLMCESHTWLPV